MKFLSSCKFDIRLERCNTFHIVHTREQQSQERLANGSTFNAIAYDEDVVYTCERDDQDRGGVMGFLEKGLLEYSASFSFKAFLSKFPPTIFLPERPA